jgi:hypothetical protein
MKIIDASKLIQWIQKNNNGDEGVKMWPLLEYISDAENHQPHGHGRYVQDISAKFTNPELLLLFVDATEFLLLNRKSFEDAHLAFRKYERDERRIDRKAGKL